MTDRTLFQQALDALEAMKAEFRGYDLPYGSKAYAQANEVSHTLRVALAQPAPAVPAVPVDMVLHCPACGLQHIDAPDPWVAKYGEELCKAKGFSLWTNPPHKSHLCHGCGHVWRPADVATAGVKAVSTKGKEDGPIKEPMARQTLPVPAVPDKATPDYVTTIEVLRARIAALESAASPVREPLTAERLQKHAMFAADAPPASAVVLVSSLHRLLGITGDSAPAVQPLTDEQIDEIWDGTFDSADPKRQLSFRQIITRAVERAHGITGDGK